MESFQKEKLMPCYSVNIVSLDFQAGDLGLLQKAAAALGLEVRVRGDRREVMDRPAT